MTAGPKWLVRQSIEKFKLKSEKCKIGRGVRSRFCILAFKICIFIRLLPEK